MAARPRFFTPAADPAHLPLVVADPVVRQVERAARMAAIEHDLTGLLTLGLVNVAKHLLRSMSICFAILARFGRIGTDICKEKRVLQHFLDLQYYLLRC